MNIRFCYHSETFPPWILSEEISSCCLHDPRDAYSTFTLYHGDSRHVKRCQWSVRFNVQVASSRLHIGLFQKYELSCSFPILRYPIKQYASYAEEKVLFHEPRYI